MMRVIEGDPLFGWAGRSAEDRTVRNGEAAGSTPAQSIFCFYRQIHTIVTPNVCTENLEESTLGSCIGEETATESLLPIPPSHEITGKALNSECENRFFYRCRSQFVIKFFKGIRRGCFWENIHSLHRCWYPWEGRGLPSRRTRCSRITSPIRYSSRPGRGSASGEMVNRSS
jgi:hypothetical protein